MFTRGANSINVGNAAALASAIAGASNGNGARLVDTAPTTYSASGSLDALALSSTVFAFTNVDMGGGISYALNLTSWTGGGAAALATAPANTYSIDVTLIWSDSTGLIQLCQESYELFSGTSSVLTASQVISGPAKGAKLTVIVTNGNAATWGTGGAGSGYQATLVSHSKPLPFTTITSPVGQSSGGGNDGVLIGSTGTLAASGTIGPLLCWPALGQIQVASYVAAAVTVNYRYQFGLARRVLIQRTITFPAANQTSDMPQFLGTGRPLLITLVNTTATAGAYNLYAWSNLER